jgi:ATP-binding cassette, subfamily C, bacterial
MKHPYVLQHSEEDCGAACLATISKYYGRIFTIGHIREQVGTRQTGTTLLGLKQGAEALGFHVRSVKVSAKILSRLDDAPLPAIIHWKGHHWVILYGYRGKKIVVADPAVGLRHLTREELAQGWSNWVVLFLEPDPVRFLAQPDEKVGELQQFYRRIWFFRDLLGQILLLNMVLGLLSLAYPFLVQVLTDDVLVRGNARMLTTVAIAVIVMNAISSGIGFVQGNLVANFVRHFELGLVLEFGRQILQLPLTYYEARRSGEIVSRLHDARQINQTIAKVVISLPSVFFVALISFCLMIAYSWKLTLAAVAMAIVMALSTVIFLPTLQQKSRSVLVTDAENQGVLVETFKGALTLKTTTATAQFWEEFQNRFSRLANLSLDTVQIGIVNNTFSGFVSNVSNIGLLWYGGLLVINPTEHLSIGQLFAFKAMHANFVTLITTVIGFTNELTWVKTATQRLTEVIRMTPETDGDCNKPTTDLSSRADIMCSHVNFHYPGRLELLEDFNLKIPGGQVTALIGQSGCGKSTLVKLIAGLYPLESGNIRIGHFNLQDLSLDCLRQQVSLVPQEPHFWSRSILENFYLGCPSCSFEQIVTACEIAGADEFIQDLPDKYQTVLGEFGANLSGGQRQRLAIARAIVTNPPILILDESTSGLDPVNENQVLNRLFAHRHNKTTLLISHRPSVIKRANWIIFLERGRLKLQGSSSELQTDTGEHLEFLAA